MRIHARVLAALIAGAALLFGLMSTTTAHAAATGSVSGTVTGPGGAPLEGPSSVYVELVPDPIDPAQDYDYWDKDELDPNQPFAFANVAPGNYKLHVTPRGAGRYVEAWSPVFSVKDGEAVQGLTVALEIAGVVSGTVRTAAGTYPDDAAFGSITLQRRDESGAWSFAESANVDLDGTYEIAVPAAGTYRLEFSASQDKYWARSEPMTLAQGSATKVDLTASVSASVSGTVSLDGANEPNNWLYVAAYEMRDGAWEVAQWQEFSAPGPYVLHLPGTDAREVRLGVYDDDEVFVPSFWDGTAQGAATVEDATTIRVPAGSAVTGKDLRTRRTDSVPVAIENTAPPQVSGAATVGQTLTATSGTWSVEGVDVALQWRRGDADIDGATGTTYTLTAADLGQQISVAAVATKTGLTEGRAESAPVGPVTAAASLVEPHVWLLAIPGRARVTFAVLVWAPGVSPMKVDGRITVQAGGVDVASGAVRNGVGLVEAPRQARGARTYTVRYSGNSKLESAARTVHVSVR